MAKKRKEEMPEGVLPAGRKLGEREVLSTLKACNGSIPKAANALNVDVFRLSRYIAVRPKMQEMMMKFRTMLADVAEGYFSEAVMAGHGWAVRIALQTLAKSRGYSTRSEVDHRLITQTDPAKMSDEQLNMLVEERAKQQKLAGKNKMLMLDVTPAEVVIREVDSE